MLIALFVIPNILEATKMSYNWWVVKQTVVHPRNEILVSNKKEQVTDTYNNLAGFQGYYAEWQKANLLRSHTIWFLYITFSEWQNYRNEEEISDNQGLEVEGSRCVNINWYYEGASYLRWWNSSTSYSCGGYMNLHMQ